MRYDSAVDGRTWVEVVESWRRDADFRDAFTCDLADAAAPAFAWETNPVSSATRGRAYQQRIIDVPALARVRPDPNAFAEHFSRARDGVARFTNLGGDAELVAPAPADAGDGYPHLAAFVRSAPPAQAHALWQAVGDAVADHWHRTDAPVWVSTAGLGVHWLHVRLDARPKYYRHAAFRSPP